MKVAVVGLGYIGLPTAAVLASVGHDVLGVDTNPRVVELVSRGEVHIVETDLSGLVRGVVDSGRLRVSGQVMPADVFLIAVPTPFKAGHEPDMVYVENAVRSIAPHIREGNLVILESTSPAGSTEQVAAWLAQLRPDLGFPGLAQAPDVHVAYCPERVLPGSILTELVKNDRVVGGLTGACSQIAKTFYQTFVEGDCIVTDARTAEMTKLTENAFRDVNIAFANELSLVCDRMGINVWELIRLANRHPRVNVLNPGPGVGGHCIAVDPWFIVHSAPEEARLIRTAREVNDQKPFWVVDQVIAAISRARPRSDRPCVAFLGLAFKANVDDLRESPALVIVEAVANLQLPLDLIVVEPHIEELPTVLQSRTLLVSVEDAMARADVVVLLVDHRQFRTIDRSSLVGKEVVDTRGLWQ